MVRMDPAKTFRRNNPINRSTENRLVMLENDFKELSMNFIKLMALTEALSQLVIDKQIVTEEEYHEFIKAAVQKFTYDPTATMGEKPEETETKTEEVENKVDEVAEEKTEDVTLTNVGLPTDSTDPVRSVELDEAAESPS